jgi:hypothetical protein
MSKSTVMNDVWKNIGWSLYVTWRLSSSRGS